MKSEFFGVNSIINLESILRSEAPKRVLIVSGRNSYKYSGAEAHIQRILGDIEWLRYYDFEENPKIQDLVSGAKIVKDYKPDLIIAVGGGSVMDTAKIISVLPDKLEAADSFIRNNTQHGPKTAPIVAIPTTSGSGSEATHFAVAYIGSEKFSIASKELLPDYVIVDPELTNSMSPFQTAVSGLDALCQAIESFWAKGATIESRKFAAEAIPLILDNIEKVVKSPTIEVRNNIAKGSNLAGKAINISKTTAPHALSYALTSHFGIPHGYAVSLSLGYFFVLNDKKGDLELKELMKELSKIIGCNNALECADKINSIIESLSIQKTISERITDSHRKIKSSELRVNKTRLSNHPIKITPAEIETIYSNVIDYIIAE